MLIARFGDTWAGAYVLPVLKASDDWMMSRPEVVARVSGASGEFDYYGDDNFPVAPFTVTKTFTLEGSSYANVETLLNTMRAALIAADRSKLWGLWRDGATHVWTWGKCLSAKNVETVSEGTSVLMKVAVKFRCSTAFWFSETLQTRVISINAAGSGATSFTVAGNFPSLLDVTITPTAGNTVRIGADLVTGSATEWEFTGTVISG
ncbi:unnamed protein product, partial [marine sediment metagenome]